LAVDDPPSEAASREASEPAEHAPKRWEEFYKYSLAAYERIHQRWTQTDDKAAKYLQILTATLAGLGFVGFTQVVRIVVQRSNWLDDVFLLSFSGALLCGLAGFFQFLSALQFRPLTAPPSNPGMLKLFEDNQYLSVLRSLGEQMLIATDKNRLSLEVKIERTKRGFWLTVATTVCLIISSAAYFGVQVRLARTPTDAPRLTPSPSSTPLPPARAPVSAPPLPTAKPDRPVSGAKD
jgi:hypothetical protein